MEREVANAPDAESKGQITSESGSAQDNIGQRNISR